MIDRIGKAGLDQRGIPLWQTKGPMRGMNVALMELTKSMGRLAGLCQFIRRLRPLNRHHPPVGWKYVAAHAGALHLHVRRPAVDRGSGSSHEEQDVTTHLGSGSVRREVHSLRVP